MQGHAHWVNSLALNTDYALRVGAFDERGNARMQWMVSLKEEIVRAVELVLLCLSVLC